MYAKNVPEMLILQTKKWWMAISKYELIVLL